MERRVFVSLVAILYFFLAVTSISLCNHLKLTGVLPLFKAHNNSVMSPKDRFGGTCRGFKTGVSEDVPVIKKNKFYVQTWQMFFA